MEGSVAAFNVKLCSIFGKINIFLHFLLFSTFSIAQKKINKMEAESSQHHLNILITAVFYECPVMTLASGSKAPVCFSGNNTLIFRSAIFFFSFQNFNNSFFYSKIYILNGIYLTTALHKCESKFSSSWGFLLTAFRCCFLQCQLLDLNNTIKHNKLNYLWRMIFFNPNLSHLENFSRVGKD